MPVKSYQRSGGHLLLFTKVDQRTEEVRFQRSRRSQQLSTVLTDRAVSVEAKRRTIFVQGIGPNLSRAGDVQRLTTGARSGLRVRRGLQGWVRREG